jgi:hypothetical protein
VSLLDLSTDDAIRALPQRIDAPKPAADRKFSTWKAITAPVRGVVEAAAQGLGSTADVLGGFGQVLGAYPEAMGVIPDATQRKQADEQRARLLGDGVDMSSEAGDLFREAGRGYRPDPTTAHAAEQVLYGFARGASKVVAGAVVGGVPGVLVAGAEEGMSAADDLKREGVGLGARTAAGAVQGAGLALAALPAAGQTLRGTLALYAAGGPGGYVAQQALTREILQRSGFEKQAEQFDPFDPVGLAVSALIPAPFAAYGLRANRRAAAEAFRDGPMPSEPTAVANAVQEAMPREVVDAAMVTHMADVRQRNDATLEMLAGQTRQVETLAQFIEAGKWKAAAPVKADSGPDGFASWLRSQGGIDISEKVDITGEANNVRANPGGVFRRGGLPSDELASRAAEAGYMLPDQAGDTRGFVDLVQGMLRGERVLSLEQQNAAAMRDLAARADEARLTDLEARLQLLGEDPAAARGNPLAMEAYLEANQHRLLAAALDEMAARPDATDTPQFDALRDQARQVAQDIRDTDRTLAQYEAELQPLSPVMRRLVQEDLDAPTTPQAANPEAAAPTRGAGDAPAAAGAAEPGRSAGVEAAGLTPGAKAEAAAVQSRLAAIQAERPDMMVMLDGMDRPMPLSEFLAAVKAEADEMLADAPLLELAAQCALVNGP